MSKTPVVTLPNYDRFPTICLIGSTKFMETIRRHAERLTLEGHVVLAPYCVTSEQVTETDPNVKAMLNDLHRRKIDMADSVFVVNPGGYVGDATRAEINYSHDHGKLVHYLVGADDVSR